jgi:fructoselysine 6-kinase
MRLLGAGDNVVDRYPDLGVLFPGGNAVNVPVAARRAGAEAAYVGVLGDDEAGCVVLAALEMEGLETARVRIERGANAWADIRLFDGERVFGESSLGVSPFRLSADDVAYVATFDAVHLCAGGFLEEDLHAVGAVARVSFDFKLRRDPAYLDPLLAGTTFAFFSASDLDDGTTATLLEHATRAGARVAVATRGARDAIAFDGRRVHRQAPTTGTLVDTLGAGDSFIGRFLVGHLGGEAITTTLRAAAYAAAVTCQAFGAFGHGHAYQPEDPRRSIVMERGAKGAVPQV